VFLLFFANGIELSIVFFLLLLGWFSDSIGVSGAIVATFPSDLLKRMSCCCCRWMDTVDLTCKGGDRMMMLMFADSCASRKNNMVAQSRSDANINRPMMMTLMPPSQPLECRARLTKKYCRCRHGVLHVDLLLLLVVV